MPIDLTLEIKTLPEKPGVYQYFDKNDQIIYIGKAKNLKKRVSSYFTKKHDREKTRILVKKIVRIVHIVVNTETDALLLENNLIKKYQPRYNILLKDDKSYPWICVKKERFPKIFITRQLIKDGSEYFGPYTSPKTPRILLDLIKELYRVRSCNYDLSEAKIEANKYKVCLEYHLKNCKGPCEGLQTETNYDNDIAEIKHLLKGNFRLVLKNFEALMLKFASNLEFEEAQKIKDHIVLLKNYQAKSTVISPSITNVDVFSIISDESHAYVNFFKIVDGAIIQSYTSEVKKKLDETDEEILEFSMLEIRKRFNSNSKEIYASIPINSWDDAKIVVPKLGEKRKVVELSLRNAKYHRLEKLKQMQLVDPDRHADRIMAQMKADLRLSTEPRHIECFDNSNIQGTNPVAACVVFKDGKPSKKDYRNFNIKTVEGPDDFASMEEVVYRRYKRLLEEDQPLPQLIIIDGGKGQLSSSLKSLDILGFRNKIAIIGIAKRLEELFYPNDPVPLYLDKKSETLKIIQNLRNEAHRFGITHHRKKRSKAAISDSLQSIAGIGEQTSVALLKKFKSAKRVSEASFEELEALVGTSRAKKVVDHFRTQQKSTK
jgi:excinuclease ABC subunit C